ncbi:MAG: prolipoprotein diacylglyceryl transferase family protein [Candidatus Acidiferrum sp.]
MRRVLFHWHGTPIHSYPAMLYVGLLAAVATDNWAAHATGLNAFRVYVATILLMLPAIGGARLLHVAVHWCWYSRNKRRIWDRSEGGYGMYGGLPLVLVFSVPLLYLLRLPFAAFWDVGALSILAGMIFARIGCLLNGCCCGRPSNAWFSIPLPNAEGVKVKRIPSPCLESIWAATLLALSILFLHRMPFHGALLLFVSSGYAAGRLLLESFREHATGSSKFNVHHAISAAILVLSAVVFSAKWLR